MTRTATISDRLRRPLGRWAVALLGLGICLAPAWLFADPLGTYWIYGDDWEFVAASRTPARAIENLWTPHNVHIVPAWRLWTAGVVAAAGRLDRLPPVMAGAAYAVLVACMALAGRLVTRETGRPALGLGTMVAVGVTSLMMPAGSWFSASQAAGAGFGVLMTLWYAQGYRRAGGAWRLVLVVASTWVAGGCWTTGHVAGPVGAVYLWADGRRRCRLAALAPLLGSVVAAALALFLGGRGIQRESTTSFHGRSTSEAAAPLSGAGHTLQAIVERLALGELGVVGETTREQAVALLVLLLAGWAWSRRCVRRPSPLECAGAALVVSSYWLEWTFRGYLPFSSLRGFVPWYETMPQIGAALFVAGWWAGVRGPVPGRAPVTVGAAAAVAVFALLLIPVHQPRVDASFEENVKKPMNEEEKHVFVIPILRRLRALHFAEERAERQHRHLARLDRAGVMARRLGLGRDVFRAAYGRILWPDPPVIDDADLLDLPALGRTIEPARLHAIFDPLFALEPEPVPPWLDPARRPDWFRPVDQPPPPAAGPGP